MSWRIVKDLYLFLVMIESIGGKGRQSSYDVGEIECAQGPVTLNKINYGPPVK